jgi:hypothetical protein
MLWSAFFAFTCQPVPSLAQQADKSASSRVGRISIVPPAGLSRLRGVYWNAGSMASHFGTSDSPIADAPVPLGVPAALKLANFAVPTSVQTPAPILRGCGLLPITPNAGPVPGNDENPIFSEGKQHLADPRFENLDNPQRQKYLGEWDGLHLWQEKLLNEGNEISEDWRKAASAVDDLDAHGCRVKAVVDRIEPAIVKYAATCSGTVEQVTFDWCKSERERLVPLVQERDEMFEAFRTAVEKYNSEIYNPTVSKSGAWGAKVGMWEGKVQDFNRRLIKALSNLRKADVKFIDYLVKKYKLDECQRRYLHDLITKQGFDEEEIEFVARDIAQSGERRCPPGRGGIRD